MRRRATWTVVCCVAISVLAIPVQARLDAGELVGAVSDDKGRKVAAAVVKLTLGEEVWEVTTDDKGLFQFRDLKPGSYTIQVAQEGYTEAIYEPIHIRLGRVTTVQVQMSETVEETIVVTSEPPPGEAARLDARTVLGEIELETIPVASDPWTAGAREAGVLLDREAAAESETSAAVSPGAGNGDTVYLLDGADVSGVGRDTGPVIDVGLGSTSAVEITTGGGDVSLSTPGARINLLTRRGDNGLQLNARALRTDCDWQSGASGSGGELASSRILEVGELGVDVGGSLLRDHLWGWGAYEAQDVRRQVVGGGTLDTAVDNLAAKLSAQAGSSSASFAYHHGDRSRSGEGAGPDRTLETTLLESRPSEVLRIEDTHVFTSNLVLTGRYSQVDSGTASIPLGAADDDIVLGPDGLWRGTFGELSYGQESRSWLIDGAAYHSRGRVGHEVRFGASDQSLAHSTSERWGRDSLLHLAGQNFGTPFDVVRLERPVDFALSQKRTSFWLQDSMTFDRLTVDLGVRHDLQRGTNTSGHLGANPLFPDLLPAVDYSGGGSIEWSSLSPRLALAYAFGTEGRTVARASYSMFASQLYADLISRVSPAVDADVYVGFDDRDLDHRFDPGEPHFLLTYSGIKPGSLPGHNPHRTDALLDPERTDELRLAVEHRWQSGVDVSLDYVDRTVTGILETRRIIQDELGRIRPARSWDYQLDTVYTGRLPTGEPFAAPVYSLRPGIEYTGGNLLVNGGRKQSYRATTLSLVRHLAGGWMVRAQLTLSDWRWRLGSEFAEFDDPTNVVAVESDGAAISQADVDGDVVAPAAPGERLFLNSRWSFNVSALYQVAPERKWGFDAAVNLRGREGYPLPYTVSVVDGGAFREVQATSRTDSFRLDDVVLLDLRLEKELRFSALRTAVSLDVFNLLNAGEVLERERQLTSPLADQVRETLSPRVVRLGLRLTLD